MGESVGSSGGCDDVGAAFGEGGGGGVSDAGGGAGDDGGFALEWFVCVVVHGLDPRLILWWAWFSCRVSGWVGLE